MKKKLFKLMIVSGIIIFVVAVSFLITLAYTSKDYNYAERMISEFKNYKNFSSYTYGTLTDNKQKGFDFELEAKVDIENEKANGTISYFDRVSDFKFIFDLDKNGMTLKEQEESFKKYNFKEKNNFVNRAIRNFKEINNIRSSYGKSFEVTLLYYLKEYKDLFKQKKVNIKDDRQITFEVMEERLNEVIIKNLNNHEQKILDHLHVNYLNDIFNKANIILNGDLNKYKLINSVRVKNIKMQFITDRNNKIKKVKLLSEVEGKDAKGNKHIQKIDIQTKVYKINSTKFD